MSPERLYRGWMEARQEAYTWPSIFSRVWKNPGRRFTNLAYNILRKGPNDRLKIPGTDTLSIQPIDQVKRDESCSSGSSSEA
jgi:hypothetical protein